MILQDEFLIFGYHATCDDWYGYKGVRTYLEKSLLTQEAMRAYKQAGFNVYFASYVVGWNGDECRGKFAESKLKKVLDQAHDEGLKAFFFEENLHRLSGRQEGLINPEKADGFNYFASEKELDEYIEACLREPMSHPAAIGVSTKDEPLWTMFTAYGQVYRSLKRIYPNIYINANLLPYSSELVTREHRGFYCPNEEDLGPVEAYRTYVKKFCEETDPDFVQYDDYPVHERDTGEKYLINGHLMNAQMVAEICKERKVPFSKVFQACQLFTTGKLCKKPTERDMYWQMNIGMAMGIKIYSYWTYYPVVNAGFETYDDTACFVTKQGKPNPLYYWMQRIHGEMQKVAKTLLKFNFEGMNVYLKDEVPGDCNFAKEFLRETEDGNIRSYEFRKAQDVKMKNGGVALITELYDEKADRYGYYIVNATDPEMNAAQEISVAFADCNNATVLYKGEETTIELVNGEGKFSLDCGQGVFVLPY
ncbi:MAG: hypothetical protein IJZ32_01070 [Clostridia bacterium]|nr:hypothetical protein [Clostridia bacterium]